MIIFEQKKLGSITTLLLVLVAFIQFAYYYSTLPDQIASHFNLKGQPDAWSNKNAVMLFHLVLIIFFAILFRFISRLTFKVPESLINLPNKKFWLSPERKNQTLNSLATFSIWLGNVLIIFLLVIFNLTYQANFSDNQQTYNFWWALMLFVLANGYMIYHLIKRFRNIPTGQKQ